MRPNVEYYEQELEKLQAKLAIATKALELIKKKTYRDPLMKEELLARAERVYVIANEALQELGKSE